MSASKVQRNFDVEYYRNLTKEVLRLFCAPPNGTRAKVSKIQ